MPAFQEPEPGSDHLRRISFEDGAFPGQEIEVALLGGIEQVPVPAGKRGRPAFP
ncbi:hypothetical protein CVCC1112_1496 [Paenarthrobacter nicotinovorans]|nr:hypothetical protein CVCC1112_1496 [Paenarthrobacter nicotinovorans]